MVVLEGGGMLNSASNQYLQPDYLSPLPTTVSVLSCYYQKFFARLKNFSPSRDVRSFSPWSDTI